MDILPIINLFVRLLRIEKRNELKGESIVKVYQTLVFSFMLFRR